MQVDEQVLKALWCTQKVVDRFYSRLKETATYPYCHEFTGRLCNGYGRVDLLMPTASSYVMRRTVYAHRFVLELSVGRPLEVHEIVQHKCDNPKCARLDHLELGTLKSNAQDMRAKGRGSTSPRQRVLDAERAAKIKFLCNYSGMSTLQIGALFGVSHQTVSDIRNNATWKRIKVCKPEIDKLYNPWEDE